MLVKASLNIVESMMDEYKEEKYIKSFTMNTQLSRIEVQTVKWFYSSFRSSLRAAINEPS